MKSFFDPEKPLWRFFAKIFCMIEINALWLICSIPVITLGASTAALYYTASRLVSGDEYGVIHTFFSSFRRNLKQGALLGVCAIAAGALCLYNFYFYIIAPGRITSILQSFHLVVILFYLMITAWLFPVLSRFDNSIRNILLFSFYISFRYFPYTFLMIVTEVSILLISFFYIPLLALWGMGLVAYVNSFCINAVFSRYISEMTPDVDVQNTKQDETK